MTTAPVPCALADLQTPAPLVDAAILAANLARMAQAWPGERLRPHVKAHKCTELARHQRSGGHPGFTCVFSPPDGGSLPQVGDQVRVLPAHVDPTGAYHERLYLVEGDRVMEAWPVDLRGW